MDAHELELKQERLKLLEDVRAAQAQFAAGKGIPHEEAKTRILRRLEE